MSAPLTAGALAGLADPQDALSRLAAMAEGWDLHARPAGDDGLELLGAGWSVALRPAPGGLSLAAEAGDEAILRGLKEMAEFMLADLSPDLRTQILQAEQYRAVARHAAEAVVGYALRHAVNEGQQDNTTALVVVLGAQAALALSERRGGGDG